MCLVRTETEITEKILKNCQMYLKATENGKEYTNYSIMANVTYRQMNLITVTIPTLPSSSRRRRSTDGSISGWDISLSYDNTTFSNATSVVVYNGATESCDYTTYTCTKVVEICICTLFFLSSVSHYLFLNNIQEIHLYIVTDHKSIPRMQI